MKSTCYSCLPFDADLLQNRATTHRGELEKGDLFKMEGDQRGARIRCLEGVLWVTEQGGASDVILQVGEGCTINRRGMVLVESLEDACFEVLACR